MNSLVRPREPFGSRSAPPNAFSIIYIVALQLLLFLHTREQEKLTLWNCEDETLYPANDRVSSSRLNRSHRVCTKIPTGSAPTAAEPVFVFRELKVQLQRQGRDARIARRRHLSVRRRAQCGPDARPVGVVES